MCAYRYQEEYGYWTSDSDTSDEGGYTINDGEGGRDTGFSPALPDPPPPPPPEETSELVDTTPTIITLNEIDEYNGSSAGYIPAGQFTEARAYPLAAVNAAKSGATKIVLVKNQRTNYNYAAMSNEIFRFPYYVPPGANLATMPYPIITWEWSMQQDAGYYGPQSMEIAAVNTAAPETKDTTSLTAPPNNSLRFSTGTRTFTLVTDQILSFTPGVFNEFKFRIRVGNPRLLPTNGAGPAFNNIEMQWMISNIKTSVPTGHSFEVKLQKNWESYFNINVVKDTDRNQKGTTTSLQTVANTPEPIGNGWTLSNSWSWNEYNTAAGFKHWEIPVSTFTGNKNYNIPIIVFPENDDFCSMEPSFKIPGPKAPWNLVSRHESFWYAPTWMRSSDYAQNIGTNAVFYCPRNFRGVVWLKPGTAVNDIL